MGVGHRLPPRDTRSVDGTASPPPSPPTLLGRSQGHSSGEGKRLRPARTCEVKVACEGCLAHSGQRLRPEAWWLACNTGPPVGALHLQHRLIIIITSAAPRLQLRASSRGEVKKKNVTPRTMTTCKWRERTTAIPACAPIPRWAFSPMVFWTSREEEGRVPWQATSLLHIGFQDINGQRVACFLLRNLQRGQLPLPQGLHKGRARLCRIEEKPGQVFCAGRGCRWQREGDKSTFGRCKEVQG